MTFTNKEIEEKKEEIIKEFLELDIMNITPWKLYQIGILKGIDLI